MIEPCPVCGSDNVEVGPSYTGTHPIFTVMKRAHCHSCDMVFATPMPHKLALEEYNASYFSSAHGGQPQKAQTMAFFSGIAKLRLAHIEHYLHNRDIIVTSVLELGPGPGFFARHWLERYPKTTYKALETDTSCHASLEKIGVCLIEASALAQDTNPIDLVVMSHVLEHQSTPIKFIHNSTLNLRKGGAIFIEVPCRDWEHKATNEPHLLFFDKRPMQHVLIESGFSDIELSYHGQEIDRLRSASPIQSVHRGIRSKLIDLGLITPFARIEPGLESLDPLERAVTAPFKAHCEMRKPAWWLRAVARKN